ncbi:TetR/AcrR family transcriptional regulator [Gluconobacter cerevisiae]|uniref:TetR/AcrR family transcriptional regulator n=1 Tax=Gluconobacter cerevisiae TaxID=1379734 RepID=A0ABR9YA05_9PROT|nr:TetR/AcrR family transcriptional regulator [Gluconobacter cerevisiae]
MLPSQSSSQSEDRKQSCCGRPAQLDEAERRNRILDAASSVLITHGYHAASMDSIASCSGMSKKTLYQFFDSKQVLFETLILERLFAPINYTPVPTDSMEKQLLGLMTSIAACMFCDERLSLLRSVITETSRNPAVRQLVADLFQLSGRVLPIQHWMTIQSAAGKLDIPDITEASDLLFGMTLGGPTLGRLTHCKPSRSKEKLEEFMAYGIRVFLEGHRPVSPPPNGH